MADEMQLRLWQHVIRHATDKWPSQTLDELTKWALNTLTPREEKVLRLRYGLSDGRRRTQEEIGQNFGLTQPSISRIEKRAVSKLAHPSRRAKIESFAIARGLSVIEDFPQVRVR